MKRKLKIKYLFFITLCYLSGYAFGETKLISKNNNEWIEFYNGKDSEYLIITSNNQPNYCILISSSTGVPLTKGRIFYDDSIDALKMALRFAYLNPAEKWWSVDIYKKNDLNKSVKTMPITPSVDCYNGGLTLEVIEYKPPFYFVAIKLINQEFHTIGFIKSDKILNKNNFDFILLDIIYMKNRERFEVLSCSTTNFDCKNSKYSYPYQYFSKLSQNN
ncbi:hypothetical protein J3U57_02325 [Gilliamella sp. B3464]|uniref:hypothetical protein n=1 Tax=unclassified Gilliamella TaxID=2685620 RepID=UPI00226AB40A|nr:MULTISPECIES: hypothetical protein [unclassified Gilliamella]MCX8711357.1 hypothetical protein [Gilliamella sp. B3468]MCX8728698.1 hypothetical protein [Gilliamella sp. B2838]MCX8750407.1 hypothetical protein [Gilliamella sp. B3464]